MHISCFLMLSLTQLLGVSSAADPNANVHEIPRLITELGSNDFKKREAATQALDALGPAALQALNKASRGTDPEIRRRAERLAQLIEKRVETAQILEPKHVRLVCQDMPISDALEDFSKKTGFAIQLGTEAWKFADRKITIDTGETTFWQALDQFCEKAGLVERAHPQVTTADQNWQARALQNGQLRAAQGGAIVIMPSSPYQNRSRVGESPLRLVPSKEKSLPAFQAGAVRIRALAATGNPWKQSANSGEAMFLLDVAPQPKMVWHNIEARVDRAVDNNDQNLSPVETYSGDAARIAAALANGGVLWDPQTGTQALVGSREMPVRFKKGEKPSRMLKELEGVLVAQVQAPPRVVISVSNILKAAGQTVKGSDGKSIKILEIETHANGTVAVNFRLEDPSGLRGVMAMNRRVVMRANGVVMRRALAGIEDSTSQVDSGFALQDANGQSFQMGGRNDNLTVNGNALVWEIHMTFRPRDGQAEPAKFLYTVRPWVVIEVPFTLKDVPLG